MLKSNHEKIDLIIFNTKHKNRIITEDMQPSGFKLNSSLKREEQVNSIFVLSSIISQPMLAKTWPCPHNIKAGLWQCSPVWHPRYTDDTDSTESTEFCSSTGELSAPVEVQDPDVNL